MPDNDHCCVPDCVADERKDKSLTFDNIPKEKILRKKWINAIRRDHGKHFEMTENLKVCSLYFDYDDFKLATTRRRIKVVLCHQGLRGLILQLRVTTCTLRYSSHRFFSFHLMAYC